MVVSLHFLAHSYLVIQLLACYRWVIRIFFAEFRWPPRFVLCIVTPLTLSTIEHKASTTLTLWKAIQPTTEWPIEIIKSSDFCKMTTLIPMLHNWSELYHHQWQWHHQLLPSSSMAQTSLPHVSQPSELLLHNGRRCCFKSTAC